MDPSPPPPYTTAAPGRRARAAQGEARPSTNPPVNTSSPRRVSSPTSPKSLSRSKASPGEVRSMADEMLRRSVPGSGATPPPLPSSESVPPASNEVEGSAGIAHQSSNVEHYASASVASSASTAVPPSYDNKWPSPARADPQKLKRQLQRELEQANTESARHDTTGLFKKASSTDLLFLIDTTKSMEPYLKTVKEQVIKIVAEIKQVFLNEAEVRIAVVSYKDHNCKVNVEFLDFTPSADEVRAFLSKLQPGYGKDFAEDVLGGVQQALHASWKLQNRCIVHIGDAPPHGHTLHDMARNADDYYEPGTEPHGLTYEPLLQKLVQSRINYALFRITSKTDKMALVFARVYGSGNGKLHDSNVYYKQLKAEASTRSTGSLVSEPHFEELKLGASYKDIQHLVVRTVSNSFSRTAGRVSKAWSTESNAAKQKFVKNLASINEDEGTTVGSRGTGGGIELALEKVQPQWTTPSWFDERLEVQGFLPAVVVHNAETLGAMMAAEENIKLNVGDFTIYARSKPFDQGAMRRAFYARTAHSNNHFVVKSFIKDTHGRPHLAEDMRMQALCKAFALEFNGLLKIEPPLDFVVTACLTSKSKTNFATGNGFLSLEPYIKGKYVKYNSNGGYVNDELSGDQFNLIAQAFSHFTFERSYGHLLVNDLQGVSHLLTDPAIQTRDPERFKLNDTNMGVEGFKFFFATHDCNKFCEQLGLESRAAMLLTGEYKFRKKWPTMDPTVCCSNKLCRTIIRQAESHESSKFPGQYWCNVCWSQLESSMIPWICVEPGPNHEFEVSRFYYESQGQPTPVKCPAHRGKDATESSAAVVGGGLWSRMKAGFSKTTINGNVW